MTRLFRLNGAKSYLRTMYFIANDEADAKSLANESGRLVHVEGGELSVTDETDTQLAGHRGESLKVFLDAGNRGLAYKDFDAWYCIPLSSACDWLHDAAIQHETCPRCGARKGMRCHVTDATPLYEGSAHRIRVRYLVKRHPEVLNAPIPAPSVAETVPPEDGGDPENN